MIDPDKQPPDWRAVADTLATALRGGHCWLRAAKQAAHGVCDLTNLIIDAQPHGFGVADMREALDAYRKAAGEDAPDA